MKKLLSSIFALLIGAGAFAQGFNVQVCVTLSGPPLNAPATATLTYYANGVANTSSVTISNVSLPYTFCFPSYMQLPDSGNYAYASGTVQLSTCAPMFSYSYGQLISGSDSIMVNAQNCNSSASCGVNVSSTAGTTILQATATGTAPFTYSWDGGITYSSANSYTTSGTGTYCVTAMDASGCTSTDCYTYTSGCQGSIVMLTNPNGTDYLYAIADSNNAFGVSYQWSMNGVPISTTGATIYPNAAGNYCVNISYANGCVATACYNYSPGAGGCNVTFIAIQDSLNPNLYYFFANPNGVGPFTYFWTFSNGTTSTAVTPTVLFNSTNTGISWASVTVTDNGGCVSSYSMSLVTTPPSNLCSNGFNAYANYLNGGSAGEVMFMSYAGNSAGTITYSWDFGDGSGGSSSANPTHTYAATGYYNVCLTTMYNGCTYTSCNNVYVDLAWWNSNPFQGNCTAGFIIMPGGSNAAGLLSIVNTSQGSNLLYTWSFGNGFVSNNPLPFTTITNAGVYAICVSIQDTVSGCSDTFCDTITVDSLGNISRSSWNGNIGIYVSGSPQPNAMVGSIALDEATAELSIAPNPSNGNINLNASWAQGTANIQVIDISGKLVYSSMVNTARGQRSVALNMQDLANGSYLVKVISNNKVETAKLVINR